MGRRLGESRSTHREMYRVHIICGQQGRSAVGIASLQFPGWHIVDFLSLAADPRVGRRSATSRNSASWGCLPPQTPLHPVLISEAILLPAAMIEGRDTFLSPTFVSGSANAGHLASAPPGRPSYPMRPGNGARGSRYRKIRGAANGIGILTESGFRLSFGLFQKILSGSSRRVI